MRSRTLAIIILIIFLILPGFLYWYFFYGKVSSITFLSSITGQDFDVLLE